MTILTFQDGCPEGFKLTYPVTEINFPPSQGSKLVNPCFGKSHDLTRPTFPGDEGFEEELAETVAVRNAVLRGEMPEWFFDRYGIETELVQPIRVEAQFGADLLGVSLAEGLADLVRMDSPTDLGRILIRFLASNGAKIKTDLDGHVPFIETHSQTLDILGTYVHRALRAAFEAKYYFGRPRPGAVIRSREPNIREDFSQYPWPNHPAYPAGHGAAAGATIAALEQTFDLTPGELTLVIQAAAQFAMGRTHAGMHYANDNIAGLLLGYSVNQIILD